MIINKEGSVFEYEGRKFVIGEKIIATAVSEYEGLFGIITEIRDGADKDTQNETPDIYCSFEEPELACEIKKLEMIFTDLYDEPKEIDEIILDEVIMAPDMILPLREIGKHSDNLDEVITEFRGEFVFLSNLYSSDVCYQGLTFRNNEAAFQAMKNLAEAERFVSLDGRAAKKNGRLVSIRSDWESVKEQIMYEICYAKFSQKPELKAKLLSTTGKTLVEDNSWGDTEWGICNGKGENKLGKILMCIREELR